jgi:hypothetical protein
MAGLNIIKRYLCIKIVRKSKIQLEVTYRLLQKRMAQMRQEALLCMLSYNFEGNKQHAGCGMPTL